MKPFTRNALLGVAGLVLLALPAHAAGSTTVTDQAQANVKAAQQLAQRPYDPSAGSVGFKKSKKKAKKK
jgi:predicted porin